MGEHADIVVSYNVVDGNGGGDAQTATITITGTNDTPTVGVALSQTAAEDSAGVHRQPADRRLATSTVATCCMWRT